MALCLSLEGTICADSGLTNPMKDAEVLYQRSFETDLPLADQAALLAKALRVDSSHVPAAARLKFLLTYHTWPVEVAEPIRATLTEAPVLSRDHPLLALPPAETLSPDEGSELSYRGNRVVMEMPDEHGSGNGEFSLWIEDLKKMTGGFDHAYDYRVMIEDPGADIEPRIILRSTGDPIVSAQFSPNRKKLLIASGEGRIWLFDRAGQRAEVDGVRVVPAIKRAGFIGDSWLVEIIEPDGTRRFFDLGPGEAAVDLAELPALKPWLGQKAEEATILTIDFSPDGGHALLTGVFDAENPNSTDSFLIDLSTGKKARRLDPRNPGSIIVKAFFTADGNEVVVAEIERTHVSTAWGSRPSYHAYSTIIGTELNAVYSASNGTFLREWTAEAEEKFAFAGERAPELRKIIRNAVREILPDTDWPEAEFVALTQGGRIAMAHVSHRYGVSRDEFETWYTQSGFNRLDSIILVDWATERKLATLPLNSRHTVLPDDGYGAALVNPHLIHHHPNFVVVGAFSNSGYFMETGWEGKAAPKWLPDLAERVAGLRIGPWMTREEAWSTPDTQQLRELAANPTGPDQRWLQWFLTDRGERSAAPFSFVEAEK